MTALRLCALAAIGLPGFGASASEMVFSGRSYRTQGRSWQQIWTVAVPGGKTRQLSATPRAHRQPFCAAEARAVFFLSGEGELWRFDRTSGTEKRLAALPDIERIEGASRDGTQVFFTVDEKGASVLCRLTDKVVRLGPVCEAAVSPGGAAIAYRACGGPDLRLMSAGGKPLADLGPCGRAVWSPDGARLACATEAGIRIIDAAARREVQVIPLPGRAGRLEAWSPDGRWFLFGAPGTNSNSTSRYADYWLLDRTTQQVLALPEGGNQAVWMDAAHLVYVTPRELRGLGAFVARPGGKLLGLDGKPAGTLPPGQREREEWTAHLKAVTVPGLAVTALTGGISNNVDPAPCGGELPHPFQGAEGAPRGRR